MSNAVHDRTRDYLCRLYVTRGFEFRFESAAPNVISEFGFGCCRIDDAHINIVIPYFEPQTLTDTLKSKFSGAINSIERQTTSSNDGRHVNDVSPTLSPHDRNHQLRSQE